MVSHIPAELRCHAPSRFRETNAGSLAHSVDVNGTECDRPPNVPISVARLVRAAEHRGFYWKLKSITKNSQRRLSVRFEQHGECYSAKKWRSSVSNSCSRTLAQKLLENVACLSTGFLYPNRNLSLIYKTLFWK